MESKAAAAGLSPFHIPATRLKLYWGRKLREEKKRRLGLVHTPSSTVHWVQYTYYIKYSTAVWRSRNQFFLLCTSTHTIPYSHFEVLEVEHRSKLSNFHILQPIKSSFSINLLIFQMWFQLFFSAEIFACAKTSGCHWQRTIFSYSTVNTTESDKLKKKKIQYT